MAAPVGSLGEFDHSKETWAAYVERLESYFYVNDTDERKKAALLISVIGSDTYGLLKTLMAPTKPATKPFVDLVKTLGDHLDPQTTEMGERFRFGRRNQHEGESVALFVAELRRLLLHCGYADNLTTALRDQFVLGLRSESTQKKLVKVKNLSLETAIETVKTAGRDSDELQHRHGEATASVHKLYSQQQPRQNRERERETENREEITYATDVMAAGTGRTIVASETKSATDVGSRVTSGPCVGLVTKTNTTRTAKR